MALIRILRGYRIHALNLVLCILCLNGFAQEMWGIANSNYAGNMGMGLNPATMVGMPYGNEFNLISGDIFYQNNYIYFPKKKLSPIDVISGENIPHNRYGDYYTYEPKEGYANLFLRGPSFISRKDKSAFGVHTAFRANASVTGMPYHFAKFMWDGFDFAPQHGQLFNNTVFKAAMANWIEAGSSYGRVIRKTEKDMLGAAITVSGLLGMNSMYLNSAKMDYIVPDKSLLIVNDIDVEYGHAMPETKDERNEVFRIKGWGLGTSFGVMYYLNRNETALTNIAGIASKKKYLLRAGASLLDMGWINFNNGAEKHLFRNASAYWPGIDSVKFKDIAWADSAFSTEFYGDQYASMVNDRFTVFLPAAVSLQVDYPLSPLFYVNASYIQGLSYAEPIIKRPKQLGITARYETRWFEVAVPYSFYNLEDHRIGLAVRWKWFVVGTDKLGAYTGLSDFTGFDFYFGFKWADVTLGKKPAKPCYVQ